MALPAISATSSAAAVASNCLKADVKNPAPIHSRIALVMPTFTSTPYSQYPSSSFYGFYKAYMYTKGNITTNLSWLQTNVSSAAGYNFGWGHDIFLFEFLNSTAAQQCGIFLGKNVKVINDIDINNGGLFAVNGSRLFDYVIIGHEEYATQRQYDQYRAYVAAGGTLIIVSANNFFAKVTYNTKTGIESFVIGHGIGFNGKSAWHTRFEPYWKNNTDWVGSNYWTGCCHNNSGTYMHGATLVNGTGIARGLMSGYGRTVFSDFHEGESNYITNMTDTSLIAVFYNNHNMTASYIHRYREGQVISLGVYGENTVGEDPTIQYFLVLALQSPSPASLTPGQLIIPDSIVIAGVVLVVAYIAYNVASRRIGKP
jgi:hypothetical protein